MRAWEEAPGGELGDPRDRCRTDDREEYGLEEPDEVDNGLGRRCAGTGE